MPGSDRALPEGVERVGVSIRVDPMPLGDFIRMTDLPKLEAAFRESVVSEDRRLAAFEALKERFYRSADEHQEEYIFQIVDLCAETFLAAVDSNTLSEEQRRFDEMGESLEHLHSYRDHEDLPEWIVTRLGSQPKERAGECVHADDQPTEQRYTLEGLRAYCEARITDADAVRVRATEEPAWHEADGEVTALNGVLREFGLLDDAAAFPQSEEGEPAG